MKKKRVLIITAFVVAAALLGTGGFVWFNRKNQDTETTTLADNQRIAYAYVTDIEGNEITYVEVEESVVTAALETDDTEKTEEVDSTEATFGDAPSGDAPSDGGTPPSGGNAPSGDAPSDGGTPPSGGDAPSGDAPSGEMPSGDAPSGDAPSGEMPSGDASSGEMPGGGSSDENSMNFGTSTETVTATIPVGVTVHTAADTETTFSRLASGDLLKILLETDADGNEVIVEIWMLQ